MPDVEEVSVPVEEDVAGDDDADDHVDGDGGAGAREVVDHDHQLHPAWERKRNDVEVTKVLNRVNSRLLRSGKITSFYSVTVG